MMRISCRIETGVKQARITQTANNGTTTKLFVQERGVQTKIEVMPVMRG